MDKLNAQKPIIFIAGGTGFAPIKAMIEQLLADGAPRIFELYWGARSQCDLYLEEQVEHWQTHVPQFRYFSHVSEIKNASLMTTCLKRHESDLTDWQMVVSGPFDMVYTTRDALVELGVASQDIFSDAFSFEKKT